MLRTHQSREDRASTPADDIADLQNEHVVYVPDDNYRNPLREAKHQRPTERLPQSSWCIGWALGKDMVGCVNHLPWGQKKMASISCFQDYPIISRVLLELVLHKSKKIDFQWISKFPNYFRTNYKS